MIFGVNATKDALFVAETNGSGDQFSVVKVRRLQFQIQKPSDLAALLQDISTVLDHSAQLIDVSVAVLKRSAGEYGSSVEAIKAEAVAELAAVQKGLTVTEVAPQSLKKALGCPAGVKWREQAREMFNSNGQHSYWSQGADGAVSAAYKAATA